MSRTSTGRTQLLTLSGLLFCVGLFGCGQATTRKPVTTTNSSVGKTAAERKQLLTTLTSTLQNWDQSSNDVVQRKLVLDKANNWLESAKESGLQQEFLQRKLWQADPLLKTLPPALQPAAGWYDLERWHFDPTDVDVLREVTWLQFIVQQAELRVQQRAKNSTLPRELLLATELLDWTGRNIQLESPSWDAKASSWQLPTTAVEALHSPFISVYRGSGTVALRAWVFCELLRQAGINSVIVAVPGEAEQTVRYGLPAVLLNASQPELYLFDAQFCRPLPGPQPGQIATLRQVQEQPQLLRVWDVADLSYHVSEANVAQLQTLLVSNPTILTQRIRLLQYDAPEQQYALGTQAIPLLSQQQQQCQQAGAKVVQLWTYPWQVARQRLQPLEQQVTVLQLQLLAFDLSLPIPTEHNSKGSRREQFSDSELNDLADIEFDEETGAYRMKPSGRPRIPTLLELNQPSLIDQKSGLILRLSDTVPIDEQSNKNQRLEFAKPLRQGRLAYLRGAWFRNKQPSDLENPAEQIAKFETPSDLRGAMFWFQLCKQDEASLRELFRSPLDLAQVNKLDSLLADAQVNPFDRQQVRQLLLTAGIIPPQLDLLQRGLTAKGMDAKKVQQFVSKLLQLKTPAETAELFAGLLHPEFLKEKKDAQNFGMSFLLGNNLTRDNYRLSTKQSFLQLLFELQRRSQFWMAQMLASEANFENAELLLDRMNENVNPGWATPIKLAKARLYADWAARIASKEAAQARQLRQRAIELYQADQNLTRHSSLLQVRELEQRLAE